MKTGLFWPTRWMLDASSETRVITPLLQQSERILVASTETLLLEASYFDDAVIAETLSRDISLLCPPGREQEETPTQKRFHKHQFEFHPELDSYICPVGQTLRVISHTGQTKRTREHKVYATPNCEGCALRSQSSRGRRLKRYPEDEARDARRTVMQHPRARQDFNQRKAMG